MELIKIFSKKLIYLMAPVSFLLLASCGSYQYSGYETDGIYGDANRNYERQNQNANQGDNRNYYQSLFAEEAALYGDVLAEGAIFTDVESYSSTGDYVPGEQPMANYQGGNAPWGNDPDSYSINFYNTGFWGGYGMMNPYWAGGMYGFDPFWGPGHWGPGFWGPGYWGPGFWGHPWGGGFGGSFGYGFGFGIHPFIYGAGGWHNPYNFYGNRFFNNHHRNVAYNTGRREATSSYRGNRSNNSSNMRNATILDSRGRNSSYSRSIRNLRNSNDDYGITRRRATTARDYNYSTRVNSNNPYRSNRSSTMQRSTRRSDVYSNPAARSRGASPAVRSSSTPRSSGTSTRSSSSGRSSSGSNRGRGN